MDDLQTKLFPQINQTNETDFLAGCLTINREDLTEDFSNMAAIIAYWNEKYAQVASYWASTKEVRETLEAQLSLTYRTQLESNAKGGRITVGEIEQHVRMDPSYQQARAKEHVAESEKLRLNGILEALRTKKDMLISIGAQIRHERDLLLRK